MASIYRFSFEHDIVPPGVTLVTGSIWSGQGRMGPNTNALAVKAVEEAGTISPVWTEIDIAVPTNSTGVRGSYFTKASDNLTYPTQLVKVGNYSLDILSESASIVKYNGNQVAIQDITYIEDNRWNLVRFSFDFDGTVSSASFEFNGIRLDSYQTDSTTGVSNINIRGLQGMLSSLDDVGINDNTGIPGVLNEDKSVPNAVIGFVGGLVEDGDIQNWQQNVASLFPTSYLKDSQGNFIYIPTTNEIMCQTVDTPQSPVDVTVYTIIDANKHVEKLTLTENYTKTYKTYDVYSQSLDPLPQYRHSLSGHRPKGSTSQYSPTFSTSFPTSSYPTFNDLVTAIQFEANEDTTFGEAPSSPGYGWSSVTGYWDLIYFGYQAHTQPIQSEIKSYFRCQQLTYNDSDGLVYMTGRSTSEYDVYVLDSQHWPDPTQPGVGTLVNNIGGVKMLRWKSHVAEGVSDEANKQFAWRTYNPITQQLSELNVWLGDFVQAPATWIAQGTNGGYSEGVNGTPYGYEYAFRDVLGTVYCPMNGKMYSLVSVYNPYWPHEAAQTNGTGVHPENDPNGLSNVSWIHIITLDPKNKKVELSYKYYGKWTHFNPGGTGLTYKSTYRKPITSVIWNPTDQTIYAWSNRFEGEGFNSYNIRAIDPISLTIKKNKAITLNDTAVLGTNSSNEGDPWCASLCLCDITNTIYMALYKDIAVYNPSWIYQVDLASRTGSLLFPQGIGTRIKKLIYSPARNAVYSLGEIDSFVFDPIKANYTNGLRHTYGDNSTEWTDVAVNGPLLSGSIIESVPLYNIQDGVYLPKNSAIVAASYEKVYRLMGAMESSVVNALMNPDSLKAGATASGDICTLKIAKPTGSFTDKYRYEGFNIRVDNASSMVTASLLIGIREDNVNTALGDPIVTWGNSTGSHIRSVFTQYDQDQNKWTRDQFGNIQFYMEAGD